MLNVAKHEILKTHWKKNTKKFSSFQAQISLECCFYLLINVKLPTIVGMLSFLSLSMNIFIISRPAYAWLGMLIH